MTVIGPKTINAGIGLIQELLHQKLNEINAAWTEADPGDGLNIGLNVKIKPGNADGRFVVDCGINFVKSRCKDSLKDTVDELQMELKLKKAEK